MILTIGEKYLPRVGKFMGKVNAKVEHARDKILYPNIRNVNEKVAPKESEPASSTEMSEKKDKSVSLQSLTIVDTKESKKEEHVDDDTASTRSKSDSEIEAK